MKGKPTSRITPDGEGWIPDALYKAVTIGRRAQGADEALRREAGKKLQNKTVLLLIDSRTAIKLFHL